MFLAKIKFRPAALDQATSPEKLTELIRVVTPQDWVILYALLILLFFLLIWGFFGSIPTRVSGEGILLPQSGGVYEAISHFNEGHIINIQVKPGDHVNKNDVVAIIASPDLSTQITTSEKYLQELNDKFAALTATSKQEITQREQETNQSLAVLNKNLESENAHLAAVQDVVTRKQDLLKKGIVTRQDLLTSLDDMYTVKKNIEDTNNQIIQTNIALNTFKQEWAQRLRDLDLKITDEATKLAKLKEQLNVDKNVRSPVNGIVTAIHVAIGDPVKEGTPVVSVSSESQGHIDALVYVPVQEGQRVKVGAEALISPETIEKEEFGSLVGKVIIVSAFPSTPESMKAELQNEDLVKRFSEPGASIAIRATILPDSKNFSGFKWTSGTGPEKKIVPGMIIKGDMTVREQAPISLIIPTLRRWLQS